jgi:hypothetical protein
MEKKIACALTYDLLPSYVEQLTSEASNQVIDEHLKECNKCKKNYEQLISSVDQTEQNKKELQFFAKYSCQLWGFIIGCGMTILIMVILIAVGLISLRAIGEMGKTKEQITNQESYGEYKKFYGETKLFVFPKSLDKAKEVVNYYYSCEGSKSNPTCQIYLECKYSKEEYEKEVARLAAVHEEYAGMKNTIRYDKEKFYYPAYYAQYFSDSCFEYALLIEEENKIVYLYLQALDIDSMVFNQNYLPKNYGFLASYFGEEANIYNMYLFETQKEGKVHSYDEATDEQRIKSVEKYY